MRNGLVTLAVLCLCLCTACPYPRVTVTIAPPEVCPGGSASAIWETDAERAEGRLDPGPPTPRTLPPSGSSPIPATEDVAVIVGAWKNGLYSSAAARLHVITEARSFTLNVPLACTGGTLTGSSVVVVPRGLGGLLKVISISSSAQRAITVIHGGGSANLPGGGGTLIGSVVDGTWSIVSPVQVNERCGQERMGDTLMPAPTSIGLEITATCGGETPVPARPPSGPGNIGQQCLPGAACFGSGVCQIGTSVCIDPSSPSRTATAARCNGEPATAASLLYGVKLEDEHGCAAILVEYANSRQDAENCALRRFPFRATVQTGTLQPFTFCKTSLLGSDSITIHAFSAQSAAACMRYTYSDATSITAGPCM